MPPGQTLMDANRTYAYNIACAPVASAPEAPCAPAPPTHCRSPIIASAKQGVACWHLTSSMTMPRPAPTRLPPCPAA